jgi:hypothetical protein
MLGTQLLPGIVEIDEVAAAYIDRSDGYPHLAAVVDTVEIHQLFQRLLERAGIVKTDFCRAAGVLQGPGQAGPVKTVLSLQHRAPGFPASQHVLHAGWPVLGIQHG